MLACTVQVIAEPIAIVLNLQAPRCRQTTPSQLLQYAKLTYIPSYAVDGAEAARDSIVKTPAIPIGSALAPDQPRCIASRPLPLALS